LQATNLKEFLDSKPLYYKEIDHERIHIAHDRLKPHIKRPKTIHIVGTNGKGSTGRMIAYLAWRQGARKQEVGGRSYSVGHYSSPHIMKFNERIWIDGADASDEVLEVAHHKLYDILGKELSGSLSYFEYSTLLAFVVFEDCDLMVLEAGLGGEHDATNVCDKELSVITPIGIDHQAFLGDTIEEIAATKLRSIQKQALLAPQVYDEVVEVAQNIAKDVGADLRVCPRVNTQVDPYELQKIAQAKGWPNYLIQNAKVAMQALEILGIAYEAEDLMDLELFGRFYPLRSNIHIDVGHNPLAARALVDALKPNTILIYNSLDDKDYEEVLRTLKPKLKSVEIIPIDSQRAATLEAIEASLQKLNIDYRYFDGDIDSSEEYLVFGSFYTVEAFLKATNL